MNERFYVKMHYPRDHVYLYENGVVFFVEYVVPDGHLTRFNYRGENKVHDLTSLTDVFIYRGMDYMTEALPKAREICDVVEKHHRFLLGLDRSLNSCKL